MDWSNERYVRLFTRNTAAWALWPWQARAILPLLLRSADRAGLIDASEGFAGIAALILMPLEVVEVGMQALTAGDSSPVAVTPHGYLIRNFLEAQDAPQSDRQRAKESRSRRRDLAKASVTKRDDGVTNRDRHEESHGVTSGHENQESVTNRDDTVTQRTESSHAVTTCHSEPSLSEPSRAGLISDAPPAAPAPIKNSSAAELTNRLWQEHCAAFDLLRTELGIDVPSLQRGNMPLGWRDLRERVRGYGEDLAEAERACRHVLEVRRVEARKQRKLDWFGDMVWREDQFSRACRMSKPNGVGATPAPIAHPPAKKPFYGWEIPEEDV